MPKQYTAIRDRLIASGVSEKEAKARAAAMYNAKHPGRPVTRKEHAGGAKR